MISVLPCPPAEWPDRYRAWLQSLVPGDDVAQIGYSRIRLTVAKNLSRVVVMTTGERYSKRNGKKLWWNQDTFRPHLCPIEMLPAGWEEDS